MVNQYRVERFREKGNAHLVSERLVDRMSTEVPLLLFFSLRDRHIVNDVLLAATFYTVIAKFERVYSSVEQLKSISAFIHQVDLGQDANRPFTLNIDFPCELECVRIGEVRIGR